MPEASRATCSTVTSLVFQCAELFWRGENVDFQNIDWSECGLVVSRGTRAYAVSTRSLREAYACSRCPLVGIW